MSCNETRKLLSEYMDSELSRGAAESVRLHLLKCGKCAAELLQMKENAAALKNVSEEDIPEEFYRGLEAKLDGAELPLWKKLGPVFTLRNTAVLASGVLIGLIAGGLIFRAGPEAAAKVSLTKVVIPAGEMAKAGEKIEEMKKIEASMIKSLLRINSQPFVSFSLELSLYYVSLILLHA